MKTETQRTAPELKTLGLESGAASMNVELSNGHIVVTHGTDGTVLHKVENAKDGSWNAIWETLRGLKSVRIPTEDERNSIDQIKEQLSDANYLVIVKQSTMHGTFKIVEMNGKQPNIQTKRIIEDIPSEEYWVHKKAVDEHQEELLNK